MKKIAKLAALLVVLVLTSCSKQKPLNYTITKVNGIDRYENKNIPSVKDIVIKENEIARVAIDSLIGYFGPYDFDKSGNIYILDMRNVKVEKFDQKLHHLKSFGRPGIGPGEMRGSMSLAVLNDTVYVDDPSVNRMLKFDLEGNFITNWDITSGRMPQDLTSVGVDKFLSYMYYWHEEKEGMICEFNLTLTDKKFNEIALMRKSINKFNPEQIDWSAYFTAFKVVNERKKIYIAENSYDNYKIKVYDLEGKPLQEITRNYKRIPFTAEEKKKLFSEPNMKVLDFKKAINGLLYDSKHDLLFVRASSENKTMDSNKVFTVDVFKDGVFLMKKSFDFISIKDKVFFNADKLYVLKEERELIVYDYNINTVK